MGAKTCIAPESATSKPDSEGLVTVTVTGPRGRRPGAQAAPPLRLPGPRARSPLESLSVSASGSTHTRPPKPDRVSWGLPVPRCHWHGTQAGISWPGLAKLSRPGLSEAQSRPGLGKGTFRPSAGTVRLDRRASRSGGDAARRTQCHGDSSRRRARGLATVAR